MKLLHLDFIRKLVLGVSRRKLICFDRTMALFNQISARFEPIRTLVREIRTNLWRNSRTMVSKLTLKHTAFWDMPIANNFNQFIKELFLFLPLLRLCKQMGTESFRLSKKKGKLISFFLISFGSPYVKVFYNKKWIEKYMHCTFIIGTKNFFFELCIFPNKNNRSVDKYLEKF